MNILKVLLILGIIALVLIGYRVIVGENIHETIFREFPVIGSVYNSASEMALSGTPEGILLYTFLSSTPISPIPIEAYIIYLLNSGIGHFDIMIFASLGSLLGGMLGYTIGYFIPIDKIYKFFGKTYTGTMEDWPEWIIPLVIFVTASLPFPDIVSFVFGSFRVPLMRYVFFRYLGSLLRIELVILLFDNPTIFRSMIGFVLD